MRAPTSLPVLGVLLAGAVLLSCSPGGGDGTVDEAVVRLNNLGTSYLGRQEWSEAEASFREAIERREDDPVPHNNLAVALLQQGRVDEAETELREALALDPAHPFANYNLGMVLEQRGEIEAAAACFEKVAEFDPRDPYTRFHLGSAYARLGRAAEAEDELRRALELDPDHVSSLYALGRLLLSSGRREEGERLVRTSQEIRNRSGLDEAVGNQYGEQGPYALGADHPGGGLRAPDAVPVVFRADAARSIAHAPGAVVVAHRTGGPGAVAIVPVDAGGAHLLGGTTLPFSVVVDAVGDATSGDVDGDRVAEIVALAFSPRRGAGDLLPVLDALGPPGSAADRAGAIEIGKAIGAVPRSSAVALVDTDHDGDLDAFACWGGGVEASCTLAINDGAGNFSFDPGSRAVAIDPAAEPVDVAFADVDNDRDVDLLVATRAGVRLFENDRDATFADVTSRTGLVPLEAAVASVAPADLDKDGFVDLLVGTARGPVRVGNRRGAFLAPEPMIATASAADGPTPPVALAADVDGDGFLDVVHADRSGRLHVVRNLGAGEWEEAAIPFDDGGGLPGGAPVAAWDADGDGDVDLVTAADERATTWLNRGGEVHRTLTIDLEGVRDNRFGIGTKVEVLAGALRQKLEVVSPLPVTIGLGARDRADAVRLLWPGGVLQDEVDVPAGETVHVSQLDRKGTSCPLVYTWRDGRWNFITDLLGGIAIGYRHAPGVFGVPDTDEYVLLEGGLEPVDGTLRVRLNNQLEEVLWFDAAELVAVDHPAGTEVFPNESLMPGPPYRDHALYVSDDVRPVARAVDAATGEDVTDRLRARDRRWVEGFDLLPFKGYAEPHALDLDLGTVPTDGRVVLLLDGWIDYADSSANIAAYQAGASLVPPRLLVDDGGGRYREIEGRMGFPAGLPKTMSVDLTGTLAPGRTRVRIETSMRIYWDRARVLVGGEDAPYRVRRIPAERADLRFGGFPRAVTPDGRKPEVYDPADVLPVAPWKSHVGAYTAFGDVTARLAAVDDRFVTTRAGDEIELRFPDPGPIPPGHERTWLLFADGFGKDMDPNSAANRRVGPVPFHGMPTYPYPPGTTGAVDQDDTRVVAVSPDGLSGAVPLPLVAAGLAREE